MNKGPVTTTKTRLTTIALVATAALWAEFSYSHTCEALLDAVKNSNESSLAAANSSVSQKRPRPSVQEITIEELFTFETSADSMGFRPDKKILQATPAETNEIIKLTKGNSKVIISIAAEISFYLETLPFSSVGEALDLVKLRSQLNVNPQVARATLEDVLDIVFRSQSKHVQPFTPNTDYGLAHSAALNVAALHLTQERLDLRQTRILMKYIENSFPNAKRLQQVQLLQVFLATRATTPEASFVQYTKSLQLFQQNLVIERPVVGFAGVEQIRPSLEEALVLKLLAGRANITDAQMLSIAEAVIKNHQSASFTEVNNLIAEGLQKLDSKSGRTTTPKAATKTSRID